MDQSIKPRTAFRIEQLALCPANPAAAKALLTRMGAGQWAEDHVVAHGHVFGAASANAADLAFDYELLKGANELEVLHYTAGPNWMSGEGEGKEFYRPGSVSHIGMHCTAGELAEWRKFFDAEGIREAQAVHTQSHTNPVIKDSRRYNYVIFDTRAILSVDVKFIVRLPV
jgi:hypothetical protein